MNDAKKLSGRAWRLWIANGATGRTAYGCHVGRAFVHSAAPGEGADTKTTFGNFLDSGGGPLLLWTITLPRRAPR